MKITVLIPTYNPDAGRLEQVMAALGRQSLDPEIWGVIVVDNASQPPVDESWCRARLGGNLELVREATPGLSHARLAGFRSAGADLLVLCDDDNLLSPDYLECALRQMEQNPEVGVAGGRSLPVYSTPPPEWFSIGMAPLGCRDPGPQPAVFSAEEFRRKLQYPDWAPIGAGMVFRRQALEGWAKTVGVSGVSDRKGKSLSSAGDCDMVLHALKAGYSAAYWPGLELRHLIPPERLALDYLGGISRAAFRDFISVLDLHGIRPWSRIARWTLPLRAMRAWLVLKAWRGPVQQIRWQGALGQFEGRVRLGP